MINKRISVSFLVLILVGIACSQREQNQPIPDGLYLITNVDTLATELSPLSENEKEVFFSDIFDDYNSEEFLRLVIDTTKYVPLELEEAPKTEQQTESKKKLLLNLTQSASDQLKTFTTEHVMNLVVLVVDEEAMTMHKIREPITSGQLQISRCHDNACELLFVKLKDNER